jgi:hypothetical protein
MPITYDDKKEIIKSKHMKIELHLPQFTHEAALLVAAGEKSAKLYRASKGEIEELEEFALPREKFADRERIFSKGTKGKSYSLGAVYETPKKHLQHQFTQGLKQVIHRLNEESYFNSLYLFAPDYMAKTLKEAIGKEFENRIRAVIHGNFAKAHIFRLLELIKEEELNASARRNFYSGEVNRLLNSVEVDR